MGIMTRIVRIFKADIHGVMDQLEDQGLLLKQYLRDMEEALGQKETRLRNINAARTQAGRERDKYNLEIEKLEQDLEVALKKDKDNIARLIIKKLNPLTKLRDHMHRHLDALDQEIIELQDCIDRQRIQYEQLKHRATEYYHRTEQNEWENKRANFTPGNIIEELSNEEIELELLQRKEALSRNIS